LKKIEYSKFQVFSEFKRFVKISSGSLLLISAFLSSPLIALAAVINDKDAKPQTAVCNEISLSSFAKAGAGGSGIVFSATTLRKDQNPPISAAVKVSWTSTTDSVLRECEILKLLERSNVQGVEKCIGDCTWSEDDPRVPRELLTSIASRDSASTGSRSKTHQVIVKTPFFASKRLPVGSLDDVDSDGSKVVAVRRLVSTMVQMLAAGLATSDLQPLIDPDTGSLLLVDLSEAVTFDPKSPSDSDILAVLNFVSETNSLLQAGAASSIRDIQTDTGTPHSATSLEAIASEEVQRTIQLIASAEGSNRGFLSPKVLEILNAVFPIDSS
jgi:hypothetical protein